jgi:ribose 5-phosphate isomerase B
MKIHIGGDHAGFGLKSEISAHFRKKGWEVADHGTFSEDRADYPDFAHPTATAVAAEGVPGILICGSGNGVCITANRHAGVRAALCWNEELAGLARAHNDANILCIPARFVSAPEAIAMAEVFLSTPFEGGRHEDRVNKIDQV